MVEVIIGVAIILVIAGGVTFSLTGFRSSQDLDDVAREIAAALRNAQSRSRANDNGQIWGVYFSNNNSQAPTYAVFKGATIPPAAGDIMGNYSLLGTVRFGSPGAGADDGVTFAALTGLPSAEKTIQIVLRRDATKTRTIIINANGTISY